MAILPWGATKHLPHANLRVLQNGDYDGTVMFLSQSFNAR
jgi:hypothetical protein